MFQNWHTPTTDINDYFATISNNLLYSKYVLKASKSCAYDPNVTTNSMPIYERDSIVILLSKVHKTSLEITKFSIEFTKNMLPNFPRFLLK